MSYGLKVHSAEPSKDYLLRTEKFVGNKRNSKIPLKC